MILIDPLVHGFLREAHKSGSAALVAYSATGDDGQPVMRISSNVEEARAQGLWNWLTRLDGRAIEAGAKALYESCIESAIPNAQPPSAHVTPWDELPTNRRETFIAQARAVLNGAKSTQGRTLNIVQPSGKPV